MGTWGPAILSNDLAQDLKLTWEELLMDKIDPMVATKQIIKQAEEDGTFNDIEDSNEFWLGLSLIQWKNGRLQNLVKEKALEIINSNSLLDVEVNRGWNKSELKKRLFYIERLKDTLNSKQPKPKKIRKRFVQNTILEPGDIFSYLLDSGHYIIFHVSKIEFTKYGSNPVVVLYDYLEKINPSLHELSKLDLIEFSGFLVGNYNEINIAAIDNISKEQINKITILQKNVPVNILPNKSKTLTFWDKINENVKYWMK